MNEIKSKTFKTRNIKSSIKSFASHHSILTKECDFSIQKTATYIKTNADKDFRLFNRDINKDYQDKNEIINQHLEFQQSYTILVTLVNTPKIKLNYSLEIGKYASAPKIILYPDSYIPYKKNKPIEILKLLIKEINKIKAKNKILINIFDEKMIKNLKAFTKYLYEGKFKKRVRITLFEGIEPEITRQGKLIFWFKHKNIEHNHKIIEVENAETLIEFKKPIYGKSGFNSYGKQLDKDFTDNAEDLQVPMDDKSIYIEEDDNKKLYISKVKGFVHFNERLLSVDNKVKMAKLSRVEGSLAQEEENNIEVHISQNDTTEDSIGEGVELISESIYVNGHVGAKSILEAINLQIDGATHQDSTQYAKIAKINRHKGTLRCRDAKISLLEGGVVHATNIEIDTSIGGTVYAQNITIGHVKNNLKVYASESINIRLVSGEDNLFKINYKEIPILNSKIKFINEDILNLRFSLEEAHRHNKPTVKTLQEQIKKFKKELQYIKDSTLRAKISIEKALTGLNIINFTLDSNDEIIYKTDAKSYTPFYLDVGPDKITLQPIKKSIFLN